MRLFIAFGLICFLALGGCSGSPGLLMPLKPESPKAGSAHLPCLWGFYEVRLDSETGAVSVAPVRNVMFTVNCVHFLNSVPGSLAVKLDHIAKTSQWIDVGLTVSITHPFPGATGYDAYDVRGVFIGDGSGEMAYNPELKYPVVGVDQSFQPSGEHPYTDGGLPDGYTRWFNPAEFSVAVKPLFSYVHGKYATKDYFGTATLCPYKYFADGLSAAGSLTDWLKSNPQSRGVFKAGSTNSRAYSLRFPVSKAFKFNYAVTADWKGAKPEDHPSNASEAIGCSMVQFEAPFFVDSTNWGGSIGLRLDIFDWGVHDVSGPMQDYRILIESSALSAVYSLTDSDMIPVGGGQNFSTYSFEIPADNLQTCCGNELWVIVEYPGCDYTNDFGAPNLAGSDTLAAFFRHNLAVENHAPSAPVCQLQIDPCSLHYFDAVGYAGVRFDASGSYDPGGGVISFHWDFDGDGTFDEPGDDDYSGTPAQPSHMYFEDGVARLKVSNGTLESVCDAVVDITEHQSKDIPLQPGWDDLDVAQNPVNGDLEIVYQEYEPGPFPTYTMFWTQVWKYSLCDCYQTSTLMFDVAYDQSNPPASRGFRRIEISPAGYTILGGAAWGTTDEKAITLDPDGSVVGTENDSLYVNDVMVLNSGGDYEFDHCIIWGWRNIYDPQMPYLTYVQRSEYDSFSSWVDSYLKYVGTPHYGYNNMFGNWVRATESAQTGDAFWVVKTSLVPQTQPDNYGARWRLTGTGEGSIAYDNAYFGAGVKTDGDEGWNNARDLTRTSEPDVLIVLDALSNGQGRLKAFRADENGGQPLGGMDLPWPLDLNSYYTHVRIDSSDFVHPVFGNMLAVVHGTEIQGYHLSIFFASEVPW